MILNAQIESTKLGFDRDDEALRDVLDVREERLPSGGPMPGATAHRVRARRGRTALVAAVLCVGCASGATRVTAGADGTVRVESVCIGVYASCYGEVSPPTEEEPAQVIVDTGRVPIQAEGVSTWDIVVAGVSALVTKVWFGK